MLAESGEGGDPRQIPALRRCWAARILGADRTEDEWQTALLNGLAFSPGWDEQELTRRTEELLYRYFHRARRSVTDRQWAAWAGRSLTKGGGIRFIKPNALRALSHTDSGGGAGQASRLLSFLQGRTPEPILRRYVEDCFGVSMLTPSELAEAERLLCTGPHRNCRLHFTRGTPPDHPPGLNAAWDAEHFRQQRAKNRAYYQAHLAENQMALHQLTQKLQNVLLLRQDDGGTGARTGHLRPALAWRAAALDDEQVFVRRRPDEPDELSVDILLDGSASQNLQQEKLATQAYLIAESLTRCHIPVRVSFFCSVSGCTVLRISGTSDPGRDGRSSTTPPPGGTGTVWPCGPWGGCCAAAPWKTGCCCCCPTPVPTTTSASPWERCRWAVAATAASRVWRTPPERPPPSAGRASARCASSPAPIRSWTTPAVSTARRWRHPHRRLAG